MDLTKVSALILTYGSPYTLRKVVEAVASQSLPADEIVVIDNAGHPPAESVVRSLPVDVEVVTTLRNEGPAGGWGVALKKFVNDSVTEWAWMLDDDVVPMHNTLEELLDVARTHNATVVRPMVYDHDTGVISSNPSWCGPLVRRSVIEECGLPMAELVWWAEDTEYFQVRLPAAGHTEVVAKEVKVVHYGVRRRGPKFPAQIYYETRNRLWVRLYAKRQRYMPTRWWRILKGVIAGLVHSVRSKPRMDAIRAFGLGVWHGVTGQLGFRFLLEPGPIRRSGEDR